MYVTQQTAGLQASSVMPLTLTTQGIIEEILDALAVMVIPLTIHFRIPIRDMHRQHEVPSIVPPVMRVISTPKIDTLAEKAVLSNKTKTVLAVDVIVFLTVSFSGCRVI